MLKCCVISEAVSTETVPSIIPKSKIAYVMIIHIHPSSP